VVGEKGAMSRVDQWRDLPLLLSEIQICAAEVRVRLASAGLDLTPEVVDQPFSADRRRRSPLILATDSGFRWF